MTKPPSTLTNDEGDMLLSYLKKQGYPRSTEYQSERNYLMALIMLYAGLRVGETLQLLWSDIWVADDAVLQLLIRAEITKNKKERMVPFCLRIQNAIKDFRKVQYTVLEPLPVDFVFCKKGYGRSISTRQARNIIIDAGLKCFGRQITPHVLRHTFASRLMRCTNIRVVQQLLGHASIQSTQIYTHPNGDDLKSAIDSM